MKNVLIAAALITAALNSPSAYGQMKYKLEGGDAYVEPSEIVVKNECRPDWPYSALKNKDMGTVELSLLMNTEGIIIRARLVATSGFRELDLATMKGFIGCKFKPVMKNGVATESWLPLRYVWKLE